MGAQVQIPIQTYLFFEVLVNSLALFGLQGNYKD